MFIIRFPTQCHHCYWSLDVGVQRKSRYTINKIVTSLIPLLHIVAEITPMGVVQLVVAVLYCPWVLGFATGSIGASLI
jgi:hypothetical protein